MLRIINSLFQENTYIVDADDSFCYIIDPGSDFEKIDSKIRENFKGVKAILLTHGHFDHFMSAKRLVEKYKVSVYLSNADIEIANGTKKIINAKISNPNYILDIKTKNAIEIEKVDSNIYVYETPGHSIGSVCFYFKKEKILFSGDTMFYHGMGRVDLYGGNYHKIIESLKFLCTLSSNVKVYPGHDQSTTILEEKMYNSF